MPQAAGSEWIWPILFASGLAIFGWASKAIYGEMRDMRIMLTELVERQKADREDIRELKAAIYRRRQTDQDGDLA